jgi:hypothetical protein
MVNKQDSNATGLRYAEEQTYGVLPVTPTWTPFEPNTYKDFGGQITTVARNPINAARQRKKGVTTDLDASGGFNSDLTQTNLQDILQGFFFADFRRKGEEPVTSVALDTTNPDEYLVASTTGFLVNSLFKASGFTNAANNGLKLATVITANTAVKVADGTLVAEASPPAAAKIVVVGQRGTATDISVDADGGVGGLPALKSVALDFTTLGIIPGEWMFIGGDNAANAFATAANNNWVRVRNVAAHVLTLDKTTTTMVDDAGTGKLIDLYFGRVLKNEADPTLQVRRSYNLERTLGSDGVGTQSEYLVGAIPGEFQINIPQAQKITCDLTFVAKDHETRTGTVGVKSGNRPTLSDADAFNTSSDFSRLRMAIVDPTTGNPSPLFAFLTELTLNTNNNLSANKAVSVLGAFEVTAGDFSGMGNLTAYFATVGAVAAVRNNEDVTIDAIVVKDNAGFVIDFPLIALGEGRLNVTKDQPITIPLKMDAATAAKIDTNLDHTVLMGFFDYLPDAAA